MTRTEALEIARGIKIHFAVTRSNQWGGYNVYTLCGRENKSFNGDGINDSANWDDVTCKFCLKKRAVHKKRVAQAIRQRGEPEHG